MKKIITIVLALLLIGTMAMAQDTNNRGTRGRQPGQRQGGPRMERQMPERMIFGIPQSEYNALGLTEEQQTQINELQKAYFSKFMPGPNQKPGEQIQPKTREEFEQLRAKQQEEMKKAQKQLNEDFLKILTKEQKAKYDKAYKAQIEKEKENLTKQIDGLDETLKYTDKQKKSIKELIAKYDGDRQAFEEAFQKILTDEQKTAYQNLRMRNPFGRSFNGMGPGGPGMRGPGQGGPNGNRGRGRRNNGNGPEGWGAPPEGFGPGGPGGWGAPPEGFNPGGPGFGGPGPGFDPNGMPPEGFNPNGQPGDQEFDPNGQISPDDPSFSPGGTYDE